MIIITKDGRSLLPVLFGSYKEPACCEYITCIDCADVVVIDNELDVQNKKVVVHISEIQGFQGTYSFSSFYVRKKQLQADDAGQVSANDTTTDKITDPGQTETTDSNQCQGN